MTNDEIKIPDLTEDEENYQNTKTMGEKCKILLKCTKRSKRGFKKTKR